MLKKALGNPWRFVTFVLATAFFWGGAEAVVNRLWPPAGVWQPDLLWSSAAARMIFYAALVGALALVVAAAKGVRAWARRRREPGRPGRRWAWAFATAAVLAGNAGWLIVGTRKDHALRYKFISCNFHDLNSFLGYWGFWAAAAVLVGVALAWALGRRRWLARAGVTVRVLGAVGFALVVGGRWLDDYRRPRPVGPNVVLIILDAWRADNIRDDFMPHLDEYTTAHALRFERTWAAASWTLPAMGAVFTGQYPDTSDTRRGVDPDRYSPTLAQALRAAGYETAAFTSNRVLNRDNPITDGFEDFRFSREQPLLRAAGFYGTNWNGPALRGRLYGEPDYAESRTLSRWLYDFIARPHRRPYFLWVHYTDPHWPYAPPPGYYVPEDWWFIRENKQFVMKWGDQLHRLYNNECTFLDDQLAPVWERLAGDRRTIVVVTSDHGEEFWEHTMLTYGHGKSVYDIGVRVPLVIAAPGVKPGVTDIPVSLVDLAPTLLALAGRPVLPTMQGRPFMDAAGEPVATGRPIYVGGSFFKVESEKPERQDAIIVWPYKLILYHKRPQDPGEYYNLAADPGEHEPLPEDAHAARLRAMLQSWQREVNRAKGGAVNGGAAIPDLRALGYVE